MVRRALRVEVLVVVPLAVLIGYVVTPPDLAFVRGGLRQQRLGHPVILPGGIR
jgi:hypothetical protein